MTDNGDSVAQPNPTAEAYITTDDAGVYVWLNKPEFHGQPRSVASFAWLDGLDVERWARDYADALRVRFTGWRF